MTEAKKIEYLQKICPICSEKYIYVKAFKPATCGKKDCVKEFWGKVERRILTINGEKA